MNLTDRIRNLLPEDVMTVYSGRNRACCCGCSGTYRTHSAHRSAADAYRGYPHDDEEIDDSEVARVLAVFKRNMLSVEDVTVGHYSLAAGRRLYMLILPEAR